MIGPLAAIALAFAQQSVVVLPAAGIERPNPTWAKVDLGVLNSLADSPFIRRSFRLKNESSEEVILAAPQLSCGCTQALISGRPMDGYRLIAGAEAEVTADLEFTKLKSGFFDKYVWIYAKGRVQPIVTIELGGQIKPAVIFDPPAVRFGRARAKDAQSVALKILIDKRLAAAFGDATPVCSLPDIAIRSDGSTQSGEMVELKFTASLSTNARIGMLNGTISLTSPRFTQLTTEQSLPLLKRYSVFSGPSVGVVADVTGSFSASPGTVVFGAIPLGRGATRQIAIISSQPIDPTKFKIESPCKWLSAKFADAKPTSRLVLNVSFSGDMPAGSCDTELLISNPAGEKLVIPVLAYATR